MKVMKLMLTVLIALFAVTANAQTASAVVAKYKGQGVKSEDMMADVNKALAELSKETRQEMMDTAVANQPVSQD